MFRVPSCDDLPGAELACYYLLELKTDTSVLLLDVDSGDSWHEHPEWQLLQDDSDGALDGEYDEVRRWTGPAAPKLLSEKATKTLRAWLFR